MIRVVLLQSWKYNNQLHASTKLPLAFFAVYAFQKTLRVVTWFSMSNCNRRRHFSLNLTSVSL